MDGRPPGRRLPAAAGGSAAGLAVPVVTTVISTPSAHGLREDPQFLETPCELDVLPDARKADQVYGALSGCLSLPSRWCSCPLAHIGVWQQRKGQRKQQQSINDKRRRRKKEAREG